MPRHRSYRGGSGAQPVTAEWSSSQLVIGIAVAIVFGVVCFILGYLVAQVDRPVDTNQVAVNTPDTVPAKPPAKPVEKPPVTAPRAVEKAPEKPEKKPAPPIEAPKPKPSDMVQRPAMRPAKIDPLPAPGKPTAMVKTSVPLNKAPGAKPDKKPAPETTPVTTARQAAPITPPKKPVALPERGPDAPAAPAKPAARAVPTVARGSYGIQVAAFSGPKREAQADEARKHLKTATGKDANLVSSSDKKYCKVVITGFPTRDAAKTECAKLKTKTGYASAWVVRLP